MTDTPQAAPDLEAALEALERLVLHTAMEDATVAVECEAIIKAALCTGSQPLGEGGKEGQGTACAVSGISPASPSRTEGQSDLNLDYDQIKVLARREPTLVCYGTPGGCCADEDTNDVICATSGCAIWQAYKAGWKAALSSGSPPIGSVGEAEVVAAMLSEAVEMFAGMEQSGSGPDPDDALDGPVQRLGGYFGYGAMMEAASYHWREYLRTMGVAGGEFTIGPCRTTVSRFIRRAREALPAESGLSGATAKPSIPLTVQDTPIPPETPDSCSPRIDREALKAARFRLLSLRKWINGLPIPTTGATAQMMSITDTLEVVDASLHPEEAEHE